MLQASNAESTTSSRTSLVMQEVEYVCLLGLEYFCFGSFYYFCSVIEGILIHVLASWLIDLLSINGLFDEKTQRGNLF